MSAADHIFKLRLRMATMGVDAYVVTSADPHLSEYPASHWKFREWLSGFTGSAGTVVILAEEAGLWTDSRYFLQAEEQLQDSGIKLFKSGEPGVPDYKEWISENLNAGSVVAIDGKTVSLAEQREMKEAFKKNDIRLDYKVFLQDEIWEGREAIPEDAIFELPVEYTGLSRKEKIEQVRAEMKKKHCTHYVVSALDEVAWLLNLRGQDVKYNPIFHSYLVISQNQVSLFIDPHKVTSSIGKQLANEDIKIFLYVDFYNFLKDMPPLAKVYLDPQKTNTIIYNTLPSQSEKAEGLSIITRLKAIKNDTEIANFKKAMKKDGVAMVKFLYWLDRSVGNADITELSATAKLRSFRAQQENFKGDSFNTISGYASNGAIVHYAASSESDRKLEPKSFLLLDSGGQYLEGTTDITRTIPLGTLTDEEKTDFTLVLKGHIALAKAYFPKGTRGVQLDILARQALWNYGLNYGHGTGHGIGHFLCVHEGPQSIRPQDNGIAVDAGMITSNEPGVYRKDKHGIRIENLILTTRDKETEFGEFLKFETLTLCPIDQRAIKAELLTNEEKQWINQYHQEVFDALSAALDAEEGAWLKEITKAL
ncbi:aminopeptidase P family protein [Marinilabiliaceae bacterium JC017]|nr:aminopeptidase P family protein [Marinilabiliaceae bacterium JC017]